MKELQSRKNLQWLLAPLVPIVIVGGYFYPYLGFLPIVMLLAMMIIMVVRGRYYCGWLCAMGAFHERVLAMVSRKGKMLPLFRAGWFKWLLFVLMMGLLASRLILSGGEPAKIGAAFVMMWTISTLFAIGLGFFWKPRTWCSVCPMATFQGLFSSSNYLLKVEENCRQCGVCGKSCPLEITPGLYRNQGFVDGSLCMRCANCVQNCPKQALSFVTTSKGRSRPHVKLGMGSSSV